ncbi:gallinacin-3-like [Passer domesticus]|uniref:gallinacin-3-like n=1 Tax=Passer domesticus TaxID=48849 RepID=UPI0030FF06AB
MKILFLLFPLILLLVQGAAGDAILCKSRGGYCTVGMCRSPATPVGRCSAFTVCCISSVKIQERQQP